MRLSIIIPTFNEASHIEQLIAHLKRHGSASLADVIVSDGGSTDNTLLLAQAAGATATKAPRKGRAAQMNHGAALASGDVLYFVHADVQIPESYVQDIREAVSGGYHFGSYRFRFDSPRSILRFNAYFTRFDTLSVRGGDQTLFITRTLFEAIGGFDEYYVIMEDYDILRRAAQQARFKLIQKDVVVSARKYETNSWLKVQIANLTAMLLFRLRVAPKVIASTYKRMLKYR